MTPKQAAISKIETARSYQALFLDGQGGLKPEAETVFRDLEKACGWMVDSMPMDNNGNVDPLRLAGAYEKRRIYAHIKKQVFAPLEESKRIIEKE